MKNKTKRWANPHEFEYYATGYRAETLARILRRTTRTIRDYQSGKRPIPSWTVDALRLRYIEAEDYRRRLAYAAKSSSTPSSSSNSTGSS